jgi:hypothetical protein
MPLTRLAVMPDLTIQLREGPASPAAAVLLESWAAQESEACWRLDLGRVVRATASGRPTGELRELLQAGDDQLFPERDGQALKVDRAAVLIECADSDLAARIAAHAGTRALCLRTGDRHLVVRAEPEAAFRRTVNRLGYGMAVR